jgi:hypothetical protein
VQNLNKFELFSLNQKMPPKKSATTAEQVYVPEFRREAGTYLFKF